MYEKPDNCCCCSSRNGTMTCVLIYVASGIGIASLASWQYLRKENTTNTLGFVLLLIAAILITLLGIACLCGIVKNRAMWVEPLLYFSEVQWCFIWLIIATLTVGLLADEILEFIENYTGFNFHLEIYGRTRIAKLFGTFTVIVFFVLYDVILLYFILTIYNYYHKNLLPEKLAPSDDDDGDNNERFSRVTVTNLIRSVDI